MIAQAWLFWLGPALDVLVLLGLAATWWQLRRDPTVAWRAYEARLRELQEGLRLLVVQAEGEAQELDRRLAARAEELGGRAPQGDLAPLAVRDEPVRAPAPAVPASAPGAAPAAAAGAAATASPQSLAERVQQLAAARTPIAEIARRLSLPVAEARVLAGLTTGGLGNAASARGNAARGDGAARAAGARGAS